VLVRDIEVEWPERRLGHQAKALQVTETTDGVLG
jgi:hypothetical protein